jgi:hypothetical protein
MSGKTSEEVVRVKTVTTTTTTRTSVHPLPMPTSALYLARQVGRCPDRYETADLVAACSVLDDCGDWYDFQSVMMMRHIMREREKAADARVEHDASDTPRANKLADAVMTFVLGTAGLTLLAMWWLA